MSTIDYSADPKEWISAVINARLNQLTITEENATIDSVHDVVGRPNEIVVTVKVDRNYGIDESLGIKPYAKRYLKRRVNVVRKVAYDVAKKISEDGIIRLYTATLPNDTLDVVDLLNSKYDLNIDPEEVYVTPVTKFGAVRVTFKANSFDYYGAFNTMVLAG